MKTPRLFLLGSLVALLTIGGVGCGKDDPTDPAPITIDPSTQPEELCQALIVAGSLLSGSIPAASSDGPVIDLVQPSASVTADNILFLPMSFSADLPVHGAYLQVQGASSHWDVPLAVPAAEGTTVFQIGIPDIVLPGDFTLDYALYDDTGHVSAASTMAIAVVAAAAGNGQSIQFPMVAGNDGLTVRTYDLGACQGTLYVRWETYTVPDRIDIRRGGQWFCSTGVTLDAGEAPPIANCADVDADDGFIGSNGTFAITLSPALGSTVDIYVSGCLNGGTAWNFQPEFVAEADFAALPDCPCNYASVALGETEDGQGNVTGTWVDATAASLPVYHPGAVHDVRWTPANSTRPAGQQCNYASDGNLITDGIGAGTRDLVSPGVDMVEHYIHDILPWSSVPCLQYYTAWPTNAGDHCDETARMPFGHMLRMTADMPCPEIRDFVTVIAESEFSSPTLRSFVLGELDEAPSDAVLLDGLWSILENESDAYGYLRSVAHAFRNLGGEL